jgi:acetyl esterase
MDDTLAALAWVHTHAAQYKVDPKRIALLGESAGAYLVDYAAMIAPGNNPIAAVVSFYGPADLTFSGGSAKLPEAMHSFFGVTAQTTDVDAQLRKMSPYFMVHAGLPPFLLLHGTADERVPPTSNPLAFVKPSKPKGTVAISIRSRVRATAWASGRRTPINWSTKKRLSAG